MGSLRFFNLQPLMEQYGCRTLFETGTGIGEGLHYASYYAFERLWSVEIHPEVAATARDRFVNDPASRSSRGRARKRSRGCCRRSTARSRCCSGWTRISRARTSGMRRTRTRRTSTGACRSSASSR
jgi:hypothetical protein